MGKMDKSITKNKVKRYILRQLVPGLAGVIFCVHFSFGQELFPYAESASTMPKNVVGVKQTNELYKDVTDRAKYYNGLRVLYGLTKRITLSSMVGFSNHHLKRLPEDFTYYITNHHQRIYPSFPYLLEGVHVHAKYRLLSIDEEKKHFRVAVYAEGSKSFVAHSEGESNLMTDNTGYGSGLVLTKLHKRFAVSATWGFIRSVPYYQDDVYRDIKFKSGDVDLYLVSLGYRILPVRFNSYDNVNVNVYVEFVNRNYKDAEIYYDGIKYNYDFLKNGSLYTYNSLVANKYSEARTSLQFIFGSNRRIDVGVAFPVYSRSYLHDYPLWFVNFQKYLF